jgi:hypothetical protein
MDYCSHEKFHTDSFGPTDVSSLSLPARDKSPRTPPVPENNADASSWAGIRESLDILDVPIAWDLSGD